MQIHAILTSPRPIWRREDSNRTIHELTAGRLLFYHAHRIVSTMVGLACINTKHRGQEGGVGVLFIDLSQAVCPSVRVFFSLFLAFATPCTAKRVFVFFVLSALSAVILPSADLDTHPLEHPPM